LVERLDAGRHRKLTLVSAPAGFGKTTLVSEWVHHRRGQAETGPSVAWLSLDEGDNDTARFLTYAIAALRTIESGLGETAVSLLQSPQVAAAPPPFENIITLLINDLAVLPVQAVLVLDDYHVINSLEIHRALAFLLGNLPPQLHLVIVSREDPMLPLHRLRARGHVTEIHAKDLRFTEGEAASFLNQTMGLNLTPADVAALERRTEGWIAGLQLAALSMQQDVTDTRGFIETFAGDDRYVVDYLITEVLDGQSPQVQDFLLRTAVLRRLTAPLCDVVAERADSRDVLAQLEQANLFLVPVDNKREWYRYHRLFGDLLRYRLREQIGAEGVKRLHRRAAAWYGQTGLVEGAVEEAIHHSLAAEDFPRATDLIESICADLVAQSQSHQLLGLVAALPEDLVRTRPHLCVYHAWALGLTGQVDAVASRLRDAERALSAAPPTLAREIQGQIATLRAYDARRQHDLVTAIGLLRQALQYLPVSSLSARSAANANLGVNYLMLGNLGVAREALRLAQAEAHGSGNLWIAVGAMSYLADTYALEGRLTQAARLYQDTIARGLDSTGKRLFPPAGHACAGLGRVLYERGEIDEARRNLKQAIDLSEMIGFWNTVLRALVPLVWLEYMQGHTALSQTLMQRALNLAERTSEAWMTARWEAHLAALQARLSLAQDPPELAAATRWAEAYQQDEPDVSSYEEEFAQLTLARVELAQGHPDQALARLEVLSEAAGAGGRNDSLIKILALRALAQAAQGAGDGATDMLNRALDLTAPEGYCRTFLDEGQPMIRLLRQSRHPYAARLLEETEADGAALPPPTPELQEALNERELKVLRLFAASLTNAEIAQEMFLSTNTVKWYAKNIHRKLNVNRRMQAVAKARELGLIP